MATSQRRRSQPHRRGQRTFRRSPAQWRRSNRRGRAVPSSGSRRRDRHAIRRMTREAAWSGRSMRWLPILTEHEQTSVGPSSSPVTVAPPARRTRRRRAGIAVGARLGPGWSLSNTHRVAGRGVAAGVPRLRAGAAVLDRLRTDRPDDGRAERPMAAHVDGDVDQVEDPRDGYISPLTQVVRARRCCRQRAERARRGRKPGRGRGGHRLPAAPDQGRI